MLKLQSWHLEQDEIDALIAYLQKENYLDDTRYTNSFVAEKWNLYQWGKTKIKHQLAQKDLDEKIIQQALSNIDEEKYIDGLATMLQAKWKTLHFAKTNTSSVQLFSYAAQRGFEEVLIQSWLEDNGFELP